MTRAGCTGAILAGGAGTRIGGARKGLLLVGGRRIVDRVADALLAATTDLALVATDPAAVDWLPGVRVIPDLRPGNGSLGGLHAAVAASGKGALVVAWDMPFVSPSLLVQLRALGEAHAGAVDAVVPRVERAAGGGRREPLCAYYARSCLTAVERQLDAGDRRIGAFLDAIRVHEVAGAELAVHGMPDVLFANVNTHDDLGRAVARAAAVA